MDVLVTNLQAAVGRRSQELQVQSKRLQDMNHSLHVEDAPTVQTELP
jgi:hypothetical protein